MEKTFGNWVVMKDGITWGESRRGSYFIPIGRLMELRYSEPPLYDWLVHIPPKTWLNKQDVIDLNNAFKFAADQNDLEIDEGIWNESIQYQDAIIADKPE